MSEDFSSYNNAQFSDVNNCFKHLDTQISNIKKNISEPKSPYDHMYASNNTENGEVSSFESKRSSCQTADSEVKFLKEWLLLHLDLIQQQNEEILSKESTILILQQENEMLKERLSCMERGIPFPESKHFVNHTVPSCGEEEEGSEEDMTQDLGLIEEEHKEAVQFDVNNCDTENNGPLEPKEVSVSSNTASDSECHTNIQLCDRINIKEENCVVEKNSFSSDIDQTVDSNLKFESTVTTNILNSGDCVYSVETSELDSMRNLRMSIRRKRICSNSSALSHNGSAAEGKKHYRRVRKRRKRSIKDSNILTTPDLYVTQVGETSTASEVDLRPTKEEILEVPRWRVKVYASCYTMEGTENLDDDVYNKRHSKSEHDERRRKRWDIQRIREQRIIEKLKLRQQKIEARNKAENEQIVTSFWPNLDDIRFIEVCDELPISAFGCPIPKISPSEFTLPWLNNSTITTKKVPPKKSPGRRKNAKR